MKIAILTTPLSTFDSYSQCLKERLYPHLAYVYHNHEEIPSGQDIVFILSYERIIPQEHLDRHKLNLVVHASALPEGRGWSPMTWQILEGRSSFTFTLFEATSQADRGDIYLHKTISLDGHELRDEWSVIQNETTVEMVLEFVKNCDSVVPRKQEGSVTEYRKRCLDDSRLDVDKSIREQFNLLRVVDNDKYPAFFELCGHRYNLKVEMVS